MKYPAVYPVMEEGDRCLFRIWAPLAGAVSLVLFPGEEETPLEKTENCYWEKSLEEIKPGTRYKYRIDDGDPVPDPASLSQPEGVHGPSEVIWLNDFNWSDTDWEGIPVSNMIIYELHAGTFTPEGNFEGIRSRLDYLKDLGVNAIEIMPVAQFSGSRNWGYDGVYPFAVQDTYGGAKGLMTLVNACHRKGLAVILDVVYNHLGPEGNYLPSSGPYFSDHYSTPWGKPVNFDGAYSDGVRNYFIRNALMWCRDFHMDALRLDAVHAIYDFGAKHILQEIAENLEQLGRETGREYHLIAESNLNDVRYISPADRGGYGLDAQWSDDFHHALHTLVTGEKKGYYMDYGEPEDLSAAIRDTFVYDGRYSPFRRKTYGNSAENSPAGQFVIFSQNHDQVGNRMQGDRLITLTDFETAKLAAGTMFVTPNVPMLFMGEEYGERNPFLYFVSHLDEKLNEQVRRGREKEFEAFRKNGEPAPDPSSQDTFNQSKLSWDFSRQKEQEWMLDYYRTLIRLRKTHPVLKDPDRRNLLVHEKEMVFILERWRDSERILAFLNYSAENRPVSVPSGIRGKLVKLADSASERWGGPGESSPDILTADDRFTLMGRSMVIYGSEPEQTGS
ncbi:MAG TPA: malto-oligosyltrehalose trehalohydrolase [Bacteroides sp.]|nr:malto-oligosyltrehalose trehalohydrolase [Bacteroides sp.]